METFCHEEILVLQARRSYWRNGNSNYCGVQRFLLLAARLLGYGSAPDSDISCRDLRSAFTKGNGAEMIFSFLLCKGV